MYWGCAVPCTWKWTDLSWLSCWSACTSKIKLNYLVWSLKHTSMVCLNTVCVKMLSKDRGISTLVGWFFFKTILICITTNHIRGTVKKRNQQPLSIMFITLNALINFVLDPGERCRGENKWRINVLLYLYIWNTSAWYGTYGLMYMTIVIYQFIYIYCHGTQRFSEK